MAKVTKILETTLIAGATSVTFNDADIPNSLIRVYCTNSNLYPLNISLTGTSLTVSYEVQTSTMGVALELVKQGLDINDTLTSEADDEALSAKQGKVLKDAIDGLTIPDAITDLSDVEITDIEDGQVLAWDEVSSKFVNVAQSGGGSSIDYSETEQDTGTKWLNGETVYQKTINFGALPNSTTKSVAHGISNMGYVLDITATAMNSTGTRIPIPNTSTTSLSGQFGISADNTNVNITTGADRTAFNAYVTLKYIKTS